MSDLSARRSEHRWHAGTRELAEEVRRRCVLRVGPAHESRPTAATFGDRALAVRADLTDQPSVDA
jgi:hypothetical protein